jgi:hypothetical protein
MTDIDKQAYAKALSEIFPCEPGMSAITYGKKALTYTFLSDDKQLKYSISVLWSYIDTDCITPQELRSHIIQDYMTNFLHYND